MAKTLPSQDIWPTDSDMTVKHNVHDTYKLRILHFNSDDTWRVYQAGYVRGMAMDPIAAVVAAKINLFRNDLWGTYRVIDSETDNILERGFIRRQPDKRERELPWIRFTNWL